MSEEEKMEKAKKIVFNTKTEKQLEALLSETEKELQDSNTKYETLEECMTNLRRMISEGKKVQNKTA